MPVASAAVETPAPKVAAPVAVKVSPAPTDDSGFQPIPFNFDDSTTSAATDLPLYEITFKPRSDLYAKGNDATLLLRELARSAR